MKKYYLPKRLTHYKEQVGVDYAARILRVSILPQGYYVDVKKSK